MAPKGSKKPHERSVKERAQDDLVMSTNSSSIVSKRSVERIYYPDEPHFFRFFVKKFQRRSPLINRGYHLRLHVIDVAVRNFLKRPSNKTKVVINLGAGYDVLPWQCLTRYPENCQGVKFVDVDFPDLMAKKRLIVQEIPELSSILDGQVASSDALIMLQSDQYIQLGCDLRDLERIQQSLSTIVNIKDSDFMFVAEVSITYMETQSADAVIKWASSLGQAEFCLLEQILPDGKDHPFADTMMRHFEKLKTPLKSVFVYPDLLAQKTRFTSLGWQHVDVETLWSSWSSDKYLTVEERRRLNEIEPFDEWEEFAIFGGHYCVVSANTGPIPANMEIRDNLYSTVSGCSLPQLSADAEFQIQGKPCQRRFGASMLLDDNFGIPFMANLFGLGAASRLRSLDLYSHGTPPGEFRFPSAGPSSRMCHALVDLGSYGNFLIGGRGSPSSPFRDCWLFEKSSRVWREVPSLPVPLYRHTATRLGNSRFVLVIGGKTGPSSVFPGCLIYHPETGWIECKISGPSHLPISGAMLASCDSSTEASSTLESAGYVTFHGILAGGLLEDGIPAKQALRWELQLHSTGSAQISFRSLTISHNLEKDTKIVNQAGDFLHRYGATTLRLEGSRFLILGGIVESRIIPQELELMLIQLQDSNVEIISAGPIRQNSELLTNSMPRPLLVGLSATLMPKNKEILISGGGATCFSMGTYWNKGCYILRLPIPTGSLLGIPHSRSQWRFQRTLELTDNTHKQSGLSWENRDPVQQLTSIPRVRIDSGSAFFEILRSAKPVVIENADLGSCTRLWTPEHLVSQVGAERNVVVHVADSARMDFNAKNFNYVTKKFGSFMEEIQQGGKMYLRALSEESPADKPAVLEDDFPALAQEFTLPEAMSYAKENTFSSVLRVSGPVNMWLHYDVMANVYCQIVGSKRLILFPPTDVGKLSFAPGASSSSLDVFSELESLLVAGTLPYEAILNPGDVLYLPPLWLHTANQISTYGVAVNVFFRNLDSGYSIGRDVYGNRDLAAYEKSRQDIARIVGSFGKVPHDLREFYLKRLADELMQKSLE
ncbi:leucine carboxyl methyltransferase [Xylariales sp. PMI_506]|nr:leucine carboxyl methyltransferase [Xylariales sp. PMI_506]